MKTDRPKSPEADKSLGQHFLSNAGVVEKIVEWTRQLSRPPGRVIEIGPGPGVLTEALLKEFSWVGVIEIDPRMKAHLEERFKAELQAGKLRILHKDALNVQNLEELGISAAEEAVCVGNLPYNVGTKILFQYLESFSNLTAFCVMLQREVVDRLKAGVEDDAYGIPSIKAALLGTNFEHFIVSPGSFRPPPKVDSAVLRFRRRGPQTPAEKELLQNPDKYREFFRLISLAFSKRRKMLKASFPALKPEAVGQKRPEELPLQEWLSLYFSSKLR
jgi:16S rRNA (adenine1518-N6/adenine1519-N6)-dimethyltransferase